MPVEYNISDLDISYAEEILLPPGKHFDEERKVFIKTNETLDLQAVPGSGKTTALLAKLLIMARKLPFKNGAGVLVISHTNAAIDEIKKKIGKYCPHLFTYPNFCGTIQSFTDEFLARPYYSKKYNRKIIRIDDEIYYDRHYIPAPARAWLSKQAENGEIVLKKSRLFGDDELKYGFTGTGFPLKTKSNATYQAILNMKRKVRENGFLCYDDAYILGFEYLERVPKVKMLLQKRFAYVFVDEMQDMDGHQCEILEYIFWNSGESISKYQRIGDKNQAIFNGDVKIENYWTDRTNLLELNGSHRLSPQIARAVEPFGLKTISIVGLRKNIDNSDIDVKPHLIIYSDATKGNVIDKFSEIINAQLTQNKILEGEKKKYVAIAWSTKAEEGKIRLPDYFPAFSREEHRPPIDYSTLEGYLMVHDREYKTLSSIRKNILNAFLRILRIENIVDENQRSFTKGKLVGFISTRTILEYEKFKLKLYKWSMGIIQGKRVEVLADMKSYLPEFLQIFQAAINLSGSFINTIHTAPSSNTLTNTSASNIYRNGQLEIEIATVHSVKGQTHTGTLYMETFYSRGSGNYESERLSEQIKGSPFNPDALEVVKQSTKMMYVGLSRPTHLLCLAIHHDRFKRHLTGLDTSKWEVIAL